jgi:SAM-dependent methyltransferase
MPEFFLTIITIAGFLVVFMLILAIGTSFFVAIFGGGPFVPTPKRSVKRILKHAGIRKGQKVYDIGAGDGRFLHFAEKLYGAKATGFEIDPFVYMLARFKQIFLRHKGTMIRGNFQNHSLKDADFVFCYMLPETLKKYRTKFAHELNPSCTVISYTFKIHGWKPSKVIPTDKKNHIKRIYIYKARDNSAKPPTKKKTKSKRT